MSEQKIDRTFTRVMDEINRLQKAFKKGGKFEQAVAELGGDIAWFNDINEAFDNLYDTLEDGHMGAVLHLQNEDVTESKQINEGVLDSDDDDGFMARSQLYFLARDAIQLHGIIGDTDDLEPWVQSKIAQAAQGIDAVRRYTEYNAMKQEMPQQEEMPVNMEESTLSEHDMSLLIDVVNQMNKDVSAGDYTAIDELLKDIPAEKLEAFLSQLDEGLAGKLGKYALAAMLGLGAVKGIDATSAKHSPLGQALDHASQTWSGEEAADALELYKNIDLYADEGSSKLRHWASQNQDLINQFKESIDEEVGDQALLEPLVDMDPKVAKIYAKRLVAKYPHLQKSVSAMVGEGSYGKKKKKKKYYESSLQDKLINDAKEMDMEDFVAHAMKHGMKKSDAYGMWDDMNPYDEGHIEPFSDDDYDEFGVRHSTSFNMPPKNESYQDRYNRVKSTANDIKINRELATMPQDAARKVSGDADYSHDSNPAYAAKKAARKDGIPHKDIVTRMKPNPTDGKFKWGRDQLSDDVNEAEEKPYICVHAKKGKHECHASSSYEAAKKAAGHWKLKSTSGIDAHLAVEETVNEGMEFDEKRNDDLQTVAKDLFANAKAAAKKKVK